MSLLLSDEQAQLREAAHDFLGERSPVARQRALRDGGDALGFDPVLWRDAIDMGWAAAVFPEAVGGLGFGWQGLSAVFEECGRTLAALPLLSNVALAGGAVLALGNAEQQQRWLPSLVAGEPRFALAFEEGARHAPTQVRTRARRDGAGWILDGDKTFVIDGVGAEQYLVLARSAGADDDANGLNLFCVPANAPGAVATGVRMADARNTAGLTLQGVRVAADALLGTEGQAWPALDGVLDRARACLAAEALGLVREVLARTVDYLGQRVQFDVPIGSFQALQHRAARLYVEIELLESAVRGVFEAVDAGSAEIGPLASLAKARASDLCATVLNEAVQMHGGIGVTDEFDLGLFVKRARVLRQQLGDGVFHRERYARLRGF